MSSIKSLGEEKVYYFDSLAVDEQLAVLWYLYRDDLQNIVQVSENDILPPEAQHLLDNLRKLPFPDRLVFLRDVASLRFC
ncbi:orange carotenoid protein N-terminal domain-containing protein [Myxosarcina sp. GI1(2024)]